MATDTLPAFDKQATLDELDRLRDAFGDPDLAECELHHDRLSGAGRLGGTVAFYLGACLAPEALLFEQVAKRGGKIIAALAANGVTELSAHDDEMRTWFHHLWGAFPLCIKSYGESPNMIRYIPRASKWSALAVYELRRTVAALPDEPAAQQTHAATTATRVRKNVDERMQQHIQASPESRDWTSEQWAKHLGCSSAAVTKKPTWKKLAELRTIAEAERALDTGKPVDRRRKIRTKHNY